MKQFNLKSIIPHLIAIGIFLIVAVLYCKPILQGKVLQQSDVVQWKGMAQDALKSKEATGSLPYWTNGMFAGMPAYQITGIIPFAYSLGKLDAVFQMGLPEPMGYFFLACLAFYFLSQVLGVHFLIGIVGALGYGFATYNPIIAIVGHITKLHAIAYMPFFIGSLILVYERKFIIGLILLAIASTELFGCNHLQIAYYTFIIAGFISVYYLILWIKAKMYQSIVQCFAGAAIVILLGILSNAPMLFSTYNYGKASIRGGSVLAKADGTKATEGLSKAYALDYSMLKAEPLTLLFPNVYGGGSDPNNIDPAGSKAIEALQSMPQEVAQQLQGYIRFYWGGIGYTAGPPYIGFLFGLLALIGFGFKNIKHRFWIGGAVILSLLLSYGLYFESFNVFMLDHLPFYNKFRAPSMIMVIPTLLLGMMAILSAQEIANKFADNKETFLQKIKPALLITASLFLVAFYFYATQNFKSTTEADLIQQVQKIPDANQRAAFEAPVASLVDGLAADRQAMFSSDLFKSLGLAAVLFVAIFLYYKKFLSLHIFVIAIGFVALFDLFKVDLQYFNESNFSDAVEAEANFNPTPSDAAILKDTSYYRVLDLSGGINGAFNSGALNSYFHHSVGGYHPAKLSIYQDLIENQWYNFPNCMPTANMLNTKYFIQGDLSKDTIANPDALGNAWFVERVSLQADAAAVMKAITSFDPATLAIAEKQDWKLDTSYTKDSLASIKLVRKQNDQMEYASNASTKQLAVFSEVYYSYGWKAFIDGKETPIYKCNYVLRTIEVPAGTHTITFKFEPTEVILANKLGLVAVSLVWLLAIGSIVLYVRSKSNKV
jgi:hypothetical protein